MTQIDLRTLVVYVFIGIILNKYEEVEEKQPQEISRISDVPVMQVVSYIVGPGVGVVPVSVQHQSTHNTYGIRGYSSVWLDVYVPILSPIVLANTTTL